MAQLNSDRYQSYQTATFASDLTGILLDRGSWVILERKARIRAVGSRLRERVALNPTYDSGEHRIDVPQNPDRYFTDLVVL